MCEKCLEQCLARAVCSYYVVGSEDTAKNSLGPCCERTLRPVREIGSYTQGEKGTGCHRNTKTRYQFEGRGLFLSNGWRQPGDCTAACGGATAVGDAGM